MYKFIFSIIFLTITVLCSAQRSEDFVLPDEEIDQLVDTISSLVKTKYINEDIGQEMADYIQSEHSTAKYYQKNFKELSKLLKEDLYSISQDKHMSVFYAVKPETVKENWLDKMNDRTGARSNYGFAETRILDNSVGYIRIANFTKYKFFNDAKNAADQSIKALDGTDALILDVRGNPGGFEEIVAYFISYFFEEESFLLQEYYARYLNKSRDIRTTEILPYRRNAERPIYVLIDGDTGSAAESMAYLLKHLDRAIIVGDTTVGAGNGSNYFRLSQELLVQIATWETINQVSKTSWEKLGVIPDVAVESKLAYDKALELATVAGKEYRENKIKHLQSFVTEVELGIANFKEGESHSDILNKLQQCVDSNILGEADINVLGYENFISLKKPFTALAIFKSNISLFPHSANVYDSYAEVLSFTGEHKLAVENFQKAVEIAERNKDVDLELFEINLAKEKEKLRLSNSSQSK